MSRSNSSTPGTLVFLAVHDRERDEPKEYEDQPHDPERPRDRKREQQDDEAFENDDETELHDASSTRV